MDTQVCISILLALMVAIHKCPSSHGYCFKTLERCMKLGATHGGVLHSGGCTAWCTGCGYWNGHCISRSSDDGCPRSHSWHCVCIKDMEKSTLSKKPMEANEKLPRVLIIIMSVLISAETSSDIPRETLQRNTIMYPVCWRNKFICTYFTGPMRKWFGIGGCKGWCNCQGFEGGNCLLRPADNHCLFENWRCQCYGKNSNQSC